jgi:hypothetical protein
MTPSVGCTAPSTAMLSIHRDQRPLDSHGIVHTQSVPTPEDLLALFLPFTPGNSILKSFNALPLWRTTWHCCLPFTPGIRMLSWRRPVLVTLAGPCCWLLLSRSLSWHHLVVPVVFTTPQFVHVASCPLDWTPRTLHSSCILLSMTHWCSIHLACTAVGSSDSHGLLLVHSYCSSGCTAIYSHSRGLLSTRLDSHGLLVRLYCSYLVAPTIMTWQSLLQVALACPSNTGPSCVDAALALLCSPAVQKSTPAVVLDIPDLFTCCCSSIAISLRMTSGACFLVVLDSIV